jgi:CHASE2 domain-containing sensor protein
MAIGEESASSKEKPRFTLRDLVIFVLACVLSAVMEHGIDGFLHNEMSFHRKGDHVPAAERLFELSGVYQLLMTGGPRKPVQKFTMLVDIAAKNDRYYSSLFDHVIDPCERRNALADLIDRIASASPAVIVLDAQFAYNQCRGDSEQTAHLQATIGRVSSTTPFVLGRKLDQSKRVLIPTLAFPVVHGQSVYEGLLHLDPDTKKLPLKWRAAMDSASAVKTSGRPFMDTLALKAAEAYDIRLLQKYPRLQEFMNETNTSTGDASHPYVSFLKPEQFTVFAAGALLCGQNFAAATRADAASRCESVPAALRSLRGKIVVVGASDESDAYLSPVGEVYGFVLHANYIEALLDQRYFAPASEPVNYLFGFVMFAAILFSLREPKPVKRMAMFVATIIVAYLLVYFSVMFLGYYLNPALLSTAWLAIIIAHHVYEKLIHRGEKDDST